MRVMTGKVLGPGLLAVTLALAACGGGEKSLNQSGNGADNAIASPAVNAAANAPNGAQAANASSADLGDLGKYVGKYPFDKVGAHSWNDDPAVVRAIDAAVPDKEVRDWVKGGEGPASPIEAVDGKVAAWACQAHNCGAHQWVTLIDPKSGAAEICYADEDAAPGKTRWFAGGKELARADKCPQVGED